MSADSIVSIAWDVLKSYVVVPIKRRFEYVISSKSFAERLRKEVNNLKKEADRVQILEEAATNNVRNFHNTFTDWKASCEKDSKEAQELLDAFDEASKTCCYGTLPDPKCRYQFSMKAEAEIKVISELAEKCNGFKELKDICFINPSPGDVTAMTSASSVSTSIKLADYDIFESRVQIIRDIKDALADDSNSVVGVYGMGGLGKSTLLEEVKRMISEEKSFDWVAKANGLDLKSVGIPCGHDNKVIGCKLLLTSRDRDILKSEMGCDKDFLLGGLEEEEAKRLFEKFAGDKVNDNEFKPLVNEALHKCAGLPFLIVSMAKYFKGVGLPEWKIALKQIKLSKNKHLRGVINDMLQLSYDRLKGEEKSLLALCVVYGTSNPSFENLVRYGIGWGLFREDDNIEDARDRLRLEIRTLQASSLLLENGDAYGFKIHDLVREFVASVAFRDHPLLVLKDKDKSIMELSNDKLKSCRAICFPYVDINELPQELDCPELQIFLLFKYDKSLKISDSLFYSMKKLMVLNLTGIHLTCFPSSFQFLESLHTLCLDCCSLDDVAILGKLKGLQILSFANSDIHRLPREIGQLAELRLLDLNRCYKLKIIESGVLRNLFKLEELFMKNTFDQWNVVEQTLPTNASLIELNHMKKLHTLHLSIPSLSMLPKDLNVEKLTKYEIRIGYGRTWWHECKGMRTLELKLDPLSDVLAKGFIQSISGTTNYLRLDEFNGCEQSICSLSRKGFPELKHLEVTNSSSIQYILRSPSHTYYETLELLLLENLITLEKICTNNISSKSFNTLKVVRVKSCDKMEVLFPLSVLKGLPRLEEIEVVDCKLMRGIVEVDVCSKVKLHNLHVLKLLNLPNIKNFLDTKSAPSSSTSNDQVSTQIAFFNGQQVAFQRLETLEISGLDSLEFMFFPSMARSLTQLKELTISNCQKMETIIMEEEGLGMEISEILAFPMLTDLHLEQLKSLTCFSHGKCVRESQSQDRVTSRAIVLFNQEDSRYIQHLQTLDVSHCDGLSKMFTSTIAANLVALTKLRISNCRILTEVINDEKGGDERVVAFNQLKYMELDGLIELRSFSSGGYTLMFPLLEDIIVTRCPNMKFFSQGPIDASKLERVQVSKASWFWMGSLNITIHNMFEEMGTFAGAKNMLLSEFPKLIGKWHNELNPIKSYWQLESLVVDKCPSFVNAIPPRLMLVLKNLRFLQVRDCEVLQEIFDLEWLEAMESTRVLPQLQELNLVNLPQLRRLWNKDLQESLCFNSLVNLILYNCNNLRHAFSPSMAWCLANLELMEIKECGQMEGVIIEEEGEGSTREKITFPKLEHMTMQYLPNLTCFLMGKNHMMECPTLQGLNIAHCPRMRSLIRQSWMENDHGTPSLFTPQVQFPQLRWMELSHMDDLSKIWTDNPLETPTFDCLREVGVWNCKSLETLFPYWVATSLTKLQIIQVESCEIDEIVASGDDTPCSNTTQDHFPKLTSLALHDMPRLKSFYPNLPSLNWPLLKELQVTHCNKLNMLSFAASMNSWAQRDDQQDLLDQEAHSSFERDFPNLERLLLDNNNIQMIQDGNFSYDTFSKLKALTLACFHDKKAAFPSLFLLERFQNLQSLEVFCNSFEDLFPNEGLVEERKHPVLENLTELKLNKLHNLKCVWRKDPLVSKILQSIKTFKVWDCPCLTTIFLTETSFQNLTDLVVKNSSGLVHLVTISAVTNLVHLTFMTIIGCEKMKEVVADDGNREGKVISFEKLRLLTLEYLPNLECFSSIPSCIFRFPSLWNIEVEECPKMKNFSKGTLSTPKLDDVSLFRYKWEGNWEKGDDLNTTIQKLAA
ncbi:hypothetical protein EUGRSUZ_G00806 [Eucalyptus grandis]|uniref:Uncharacterized protein n=2 Tax=Eucalyptus grandis TaxID=71139 RepID=A0ACC3K230_EUCGR|nr:hypothetical protein EUGRSUZ_G00806 [Eucalyptus grandis]KAK3420030.1 hypothetical protein EUGRSUZ_G00806 [Eucalyptus grandis]